MEIPVYSVKGEKQNKDIKLESSVFEAPVNDYVLQIAINAYLSNQRSARAKTKTRGEVHGGGAKPWAQKGTGRARQGSIRSPQWKGGGVVFGPHGDRNFKKKLTKNMKKVAMRSVFSQLAAEKKIILVDGINIEGDRLSNQIVTLISKLPVKGKVAILQGVLDRNLILATRNVPRLDALFVDELNPYILINYDYIVLLKDALNPISAYWGKDEKEAESVKNDFDGLDLTTRQLNVLSKNGITSREDLKKVLLKDQKIEGISEKSIVMLKKVLSSKKEQS